MTFSRLLNGAGAIGSRTYRIARRIVVTVIGSTVLLVGIVLLVTPGPAFVVIPLGLGILALEFAWARHWLRRVRELAKNGLQRASGTTGESAPERNRRSPPQGDCR
jgi:tellurite resistance protein TerC